MSAAEAGGATYVVTFYSFKGGVGRTHAAVNAAARLAHEGLRVLLVDFDLEAPGLTYLPALAPNSGERPGGVVELLADSWAARQTQDPAGYVYEVEGFAGQLFVMPAGAVGTPRFAQAFARAREFFGVAFDRTKGAPGLALFHDLKRAWASLEYDYVIVDSRTGLTDIGGVCTRLLPDMLVLVFGLGEQGLPGVRQVLDQVGQETLYGDRIEVKVVASMLPAGEKELREERDGAVEEALGRRPDFFLPIVERLLLKEDVRHFENQLSPLALAYGAMTAAIRGANPWDVRYRLDFARRRAGDADPGPLEALVVALSNGEAERLPARLRWQALSDAAVSLLRIPATEPEMRLRALKTGTAALRLVRARVDRNETWMEGSLPDLAASLNNLAAMLKERGEKDEALATTREAVETYRGLAAARPDAMLPDLAGSPGNLATMLGELGQKEEAVAAAREAVTTYRGLAGAQPGAFLPYLETSLTRLATLLSELGRGEEGEAAVREAKATRRARQDRVEQTFMFTDLVKSTDVRSAFIEREGENEGNERFRADILLPHNRVIEDRVREHEGEVVGTAGDSYFVVFQDARRAVECAVAIQHSLVGNPIPIADAGGTLPPHVQARIGLHTGVATRVLVAGAPNYDDQAIAIAHRIEEYAEGEQVLASEDTWNKAGRIEGLRKHEHHGYPLKGVRGTRTLVEILWEGRRPRRPKARDGAPDRRLLLRYLIEVWESSVGLKLTTIDLKAVGSREAAELDLAAVFTDLDVHDAPGGLESLLRSDPPPPGLAGLTRDTGRLAVTGALSGHPRLVILGDAGSGKSTLMNFLALCLAGEGLGHREVNARRLGEAWKLPRLLPIRLLLRDYAARGLPHNKSLWEFFKGELAAVRTDDGDLSLCLPEIERALRKRNGAILLLDGIDEVPEANRLRVDLKKAIEGFARDFAHCRIVVTSRPYAYDDPEARLAGFEVRTLVDFTPEQIDAFIGRWYAHVGERDRALGRVNADRYAAQLRRVVQTTPQIAELARRPLLLTLMASLHRWSEGGALPDKRQDLYEKSVELLTDLWQRPKTLFDQQGRAVDTREYDVFTELGIRRDKLREALNRLAFEAHRDQPALTGTHDVTTERLAGALFDASAGAGSRSGASAPSSSAGGGRTLYVHSSRRSFSWVIRSISYSAYSNSGLQNSASNGHTSTQMPQYMQRA
jgi:class 3 adenylate cyclase/Mrp family chromosome partitioning ATPase